MDHSKFESRPYEIILREPRYDRAAYHFLREALDFTLKERKKATGQAGHVSGHQLLDGIRRYALKAIRPDGPHSLRALGAPDYRGLRSHGVLLGGRCNLQHH
jgi:uncharacterized repeat protein (TIGR04138 family)